MFHLPISVGNESAGQLGAGLRRTGSIEVCGVCSGEHVLVCALVTGYSDQVGIKKR